jgi:hypothetical protein
MQPRNFADDAELLVLVLDGDGLLEPHAASTSAQQLRAAAVMIHLLKSYLLGKGSGSLPHRQRLGTQPQPAGARCPPFGNARRVVPPAWAWKELSDQFVVLMPN